jgi:hypothetical protein
MNLAIDTFPPERFGRVSGSRCTPVVPKRDAKTGMITLAKELAKERFFGFYDEASTWQMEHGKMGEYWAFEHFKEHYNEAIEKGVFGHDTDTAWSTDAELPEYGVDFKCPTTLDGFLNYIFDGISDYEYNQCQFYMYKRNKPKWVIAPFLIETQKMTDNGLTYPIASHERMVLIEVYPSQEWRDKFELNLPFVIEQRDTFLEMLKLKFTK